MTDLELRNRTYALFIQLGRAPLPEELGARDEMLAGWAKVGCSDPTVHSRLLGIRTTEAMLARRGRAAFARALAVDARSDAGRADSLLSCSGTQ